MVSECSHEEVIFFIEKHTFYGKGIAYTDAHIVYSSKLSDTPLWTLDKRLDGLAKALTCRWG